MPRYRVYCIDQGRIAGAKDIECPDDEAARVEAASLLDNCWHGGAEIWDRARLVGRLGTAAESAHPHHAACCTRSPSAPGAS
jgi:hypothetical protein